ncbi:unnamed protein product [Rotaria magnacalcarata]|uniref:Uncharacterized protein n=1 Tax=Rotaria magnacalcarata TaxID=392030 RepID=A0A814E226_9BILA|nr:unnamed protein product [Rotaria magnacalcarata]CAF3805329.1 unnamed protein product [Rotaria magnacalcarata]CAF4020847.1 unnamed protein product [Rotaria magnacalcarata]
MQKNTTTTSDDDDDDDDGGGGGGGCGGGGAFVVVLLRRRDIPCNTLYILNREKGRDKIIITMTIRQQNANEELVHKLRLMLNDLPTLRTRALKKLKHWREAAIKRLLERQRELEKTLLDKFERLEFDTQLFVEKIERKKANPQRRWQSEPLDYHNKSEIDRISTNLRSIRKELEQSKLILAGNKFDDDMNKLLADDFIPAKLSNISRHNENSPTKTAVHKSYENNDLGSELKRVLEICTSPRRSSSSLSADEMKYGFILPKPKVLLTKKKKKKKFDAHQPNLVSKAKLSPLPSIDHTEYSYDAKSKQTTTKATKSFQPKPGSQTVGIQRRNSRTITNVSIQQPNISTNINDQKDKNEANNNPKLFAFESFDDSIRRFQRLREIRKHLRTKYDDRSQKQSTESILTTSTNAIENTEAISDSRTGSQQKSVGNLNRPISNGTHSMPSTPITIKSSISASTTTTPPRKNGETRHTLLAREPVSIPIERVGNISNSDVLELYDKAVNSVQISNDVLSTRDRRHRSRTVEVNQIQAVDNQIYGCPSQSKIKQQTYHRSGSHKHRHQRLSFRRLSEDTQDKQLQLRQNNDNHNDSSQNGSNDAWLDIGQDHWTNLLENGWRPTTTTPGVNHIIIHDSDTNHCRENKKQNLNMKIIDLYEQISRSDYISLFEQLEFAYGRTINLGNEFWRFLEINGNHHLCLYHQLNKQFIMFKPDVSLLCLPWSYDGIIDVSWSKTTNTWVVATQTQIIICNHSFSKILQSIDINGDWPKRITSCQSSIFHTYKIPSSSLTSPLSSSLNSTSHNDRPQFLLERYDYKLNSMGKHILESSTIWDIEADDVTEHLAVLCDVALLIFDYQLNLLKQIEVTGFKVSTDHFGGWIIADYNASCIWQIRRNEYLKANKILHVERPWSAIIDQSTWTLVTLSETQNRAKRLLFFNLKNLPVSLLTANTTRSQSQLSISTSSTMSNLST